MVPTIKSASLIAVNRTQSLSIVLEGIEHIHSRKSAWQEVKVGNDRIFISHRMAREVLSKMTI